MNEFTHDFLHRVNHAGMGSLGYLAPTSPLESPGITMTLQHLMSVSEDGGGEEGEGEDREEDMGDDDAIEDVLSPVRMNKNLSS